MLYMPSIFGEDLMDRWFDDMDREIARMEKPLYGHNAKNLMRTDVREHDDSYEVDIELPGFHKDEVQLSLKNGFLNIEAAKGLDKDEKDKKTGKLIRQERYRRGYQSQTGARRPVAADPEEGSKTATAREEIHHHRRLIDFLTAPHPSRWGVCF